MGAIDELILRSTKEIVVKFIETGRVGPAAFDETFKAVYKTVEQTVKGIKEDSDPSE
jgi:molybdopterin biosynthesis enzyme MoaB